MNEETLLERQKKIKKLKRRLPPCLLAGFSLPFTLFLYGPFDLFAQNRGEFAFSLYDFLLPCILLTLLCGLVLSAIPLFLLKKKAYSLYVAILFWASVMLFLQGNYLNFGMSSLAADGVGEGTSGAAVVLNTLLWLVTLAVSGVCVLLFKAVRKRLRYIVSFGLSLVLFMELTGATVVAFGDGIFDSKQEVLGRENGGISQKMLTCDGLTSLSNKGNAIVFVVDRFDAKYLRDAEQKYPEIFSELEGFTSFDNYTSLYARTFPAVTSMLTGVENDFSLSRTEYFKKAYTESQPLKYLANEGWDIGIYTDSYYGYENAAYMQDYTQNVSTYGDYEIKSSPALFGSMLALSAYRYFPFALKGTVDSISTDTFSSLVEYKTDADNVKYTTDNREVFRLMQNTDFTAEDGQKQFKLIHISGCHMPTKYGADWSDYPEPVHDTETVMRQSFDIINLYLSEMKRLGVYENSTVIITGDHAAPMSDTKPVEGTRVTSMLVKPKGVSEGETVQSSAQVCQDDLWATIFDCEGFDGAPDLGGRSFFEVGEDEVRERRYVFHRKDGKSAEELVYRIVGSANDFDNWTLVSTRPIHGVHE